jgi:hypothetical protein
MTLISNGIIYHIYYSIEPTNIHKKEEYFQGIFTRVLRGLNNKPIQLKEFKGEGFFWITEGKSQNFHK